MIAIRLFMLVFFVWVCFFATTCSKSWSMWPKTWTPWDTFMSWSALVMFPLLMVVLGHA